tara:strand:+ start:3527 stop:4237 length:711 start_codon:yes stop_codon:yes gene_type:complete
MVGRKTRQNCPFCQHPKRDQYEQQVRVSLLDVEDLDGTQSWAEGTSHRHMRRHSGEYHNNSNSECPLCTHPERANIEEAILNHLVPIDAMVDDLDTTAEVLSLHMEEHTIPVIQRQVALEVLPVALDSVHATMAQTENNLQRLNNLFNDHVDLLREEQAEAGMLDYKGLDTAVKLHREIRDTLADVGVYLERAEAIGSNEKVNVLTVIQAHFSEKAPDEWRILRAALAEAGVLEDG